MPSATSCGSTATRWTPDAQFRAPSVGRFVRSLSSNSDRASSVNGNVDTLRLIAVVIRHFYARNHSVFVAVFAALSEKVCSLNWISTEPPLMMMSAPLGLVDI